MSKQSGVLVQYGNRPIDKLVAPIESATTTTLEQIIMYVCEKSKLDYRLYALSLNKKVLQSTLTVKQANIPQGMKLELIKVRDVPDEEGINVVLLFGEGSKITSVVNPSLPLINVLEHFQKILNSPGKFTSPAPGLKLVITYLDQKFSDAKLKDSLKSVIGDEKNVQFKVDFEKLTEVLEEMDVDTSKQQPNNQKDDKIKTDVKKIESTESKKEMKQEVKKEKEVFKQENKNPKQENLIDLTKPKGPRETKSFKPIEKFRDLTEIEYPDEVYELDETDLMRINASKTKLEKSNEILKTSLMREQEAIAKRTKYSQTNLRVRFPDMCQIQATFSSEEKISDLYDWVKSQLKSSESFELFVTPPKKTLNSMSSTLFDEGLAPAALVFLVWKNGSRSSYDILAESVIQGMEEFVIPEIKMVETSKTPSSSSTSSSKIEEIDDTPQVTDSTTTQTTQKKVPKWASKVAK